MKKILITGANGMLGKSIQKFFSLLDYSIIPTDIHNLNITDLQQVKEVLSFYRHRVRPYVDGYYFTRGVITE